MEELNESQKHELLKKRQEMLKSMGVKNAGKMMSESIVSANGANSGVAARVAAIRGGSAKAELSKYINATGKSAPGQFQGIPEPTKKRGPKEEINPEYRQQLETFSTPSPINSELGAIDAMFGGDGGGSSRTSQTLAQNPLNQELNIDSMVMPTFNPHAALQQKNARANSQAQSQSPYLKFASDAPPVTNEQFIDVGASVSQPTFNVAQMQIMMETIAKGIAEKTIRNVLNEYSEQQKGKLFFEYYNKEKGIIKTSDGKYYRLTQVELRKK